MDQARIGIIGGSGLYQMDGIQNVDEVEITTPFGKPSDAITVGTLNNEVVAFLPRHGRGPCWHCCEAGRFHGPGRLRRGAGEGCKPVHQVVDVVEAVAPSVRMSSCHRLCDHAPSLGGCPQVQ